jgi:hypothetical protein
MLDLGYAGTGDFQANLSRLDSYLVQKQFLYDQNASLKYNPQKQLLMPYSVQDLIAR